MKDVPDKQKQFYGMIAKLDDNFKRLQDKLKNLGVTENTILILMSDNGTARGNLVYDAGMTGKIGSVIEGSHRVPFYIKWLKGGITGGRDVKGLTAHYDILPSLVDLMILRVTPVKPLDGKSIKSLL